MSEDMVWALIAVAVGIVVGLFAYTAVDALITYSVARSTADRRMKEAHQEYLLRYQGGEHVCVVCGIETRYSLRGKPMHPGCRRDVA